MALWTIKNGTRGFGQVIPSQNSHSFRPNYRLENASGQAILFSASFLETDYPTVWVTDNTNTTLPYRPDPVNYPDDWITAGTNLQGNNALQPIIDYIYDNDKSPTINFDNLTICTSRGVRRYVAGAVGSAQEWDKWVEPEYTVAEDPRWGDYRVWNSITFTGYIFRYNAYPTGGGGWLPYRERVYGANIIGINYNDWSEHLTPTTNTVININFSNLRIVERRPPGSTTNGFWFGNSPRSENDIGRGAIFIDSNKYKLNIDFSNVDIDMITQKPFLIRRLDNYAELDAEETFHTEFFAPGKPQYNCEMHITMSNSKFTTCMGNNIITFLDLKDDKLAPLPGQNKSTVKITDCDFMSQASLNFGAGSVTLLRQYGGGLSFNRAADNNLPTPGSTATYYPEEFWDPNNYRYNGLFGSPQTDTYHGYDIEITGTLFGCNYVLASPVGTPTNPNLNGYTQPAYFFGNTLETMQVNTNYIHDCLFRGRGTAYVSISSEGGTLGPWIQNMYVDNWEFASGEYNTRTEEDYILNSPLVIENCSFIVDADFDSQEYQAIYLASSDDCWLVGTIASAGIFHRYRYFYDLPATGGNDRTKRISFFDLGQVGPAGQGFAHAPGMQFRDSYHSAFRYNVEAKYVNNMFFSWPNNYVAINYLAIKNATPFKSLCKPSDEFYLWGLAPGPGINAVDNDLKFLDGFTLTANGYGPPNWTLTNQTLIVNGNNENPQMIFPSDSISLSLLPGQFDPVDHIFEGWQCSNGQVGESLLYSAQQAGYTVDYSTRAIMSQDVSMNLLTAAMPTERNAIVLDLHTAWASGWHYYWLPVWVNGVLHRVQGQRDYQGMTRVTIPIPGGIITDLRIDMMKYGYYSPGYNYEDDWYDGGYSNNSDLSWIVYFQGRSPQYNWPWPATGRDSIPSNGFGSNALTFKIRYNSSVAWNYFDFSFYGLSDTITARWSEKELFRTVVFNGTINNGPSFDARLQAPPDWNLEPVTVAWQRDEMGEGILISAPMLTPDGKQMFSHWTIDAYFLYAWDIEWQKTSPEDFRWESISWLGHPPIAPELLNSREFVYHVMPWENITGPDYNNYWYAIGFKPVYVDAAFDLTVIGGRIIDPVPQHPENPSIGTYMMGEYVQVQATPPEGKMFLYWEFSVPTTLFNGAIHSAIVTIEMPPSHLTMTAIFDDAPTGKLIPRDRIMHKFIDVAKNDFEKSREIILQPQQNDRNIVYTVRNIGVAKDFKSRHEWNGIYRWNKLIYQV